MNLDIYKRGKFISGRINGGSSLFKCSSSQSTSSYESPEVSVLFPTIQLRVKQHMMKVPTFAVAAFCTCGVAIAAKSGSSLDPVQAILLPDTTSAKSPLTHLGGNGPWHIGEN
jgi:hypothetical protein